MVRSEKRCFPCHDVESDFKLRVWKMPSIFKILPVISKCCAFDEEHLLNRQLLLK